LIVFAFGNCYSAKLFDYVIRRRMLKERSDMNKEEILAEVEKAS